MINRFFHLVKNITIYICSDECENGASNQLFIFDENQALISNQGDEMNLELSAATKNKICTYCVTGPEATQQVCYAESGLNFCASCGPILPGRTNLVRRVKVGFQIEFRENGRNCAL